MINCAFVAPLKQDKAHHIPVQFVISFWASIVLEHDQPVPLFVAPSADIKP